MAVDASLYEPEHLPDISVDDKPLEAGANLSHVIDLESEMGALDREVRIRVADPAGASGMWWWYNARAHTYTIRVTQPPDLKLITTPLSVKVSDLAGETFRSHPAFDHKNFTDKYEYKVGDHSVVRATVKCAKLAVGLRIDGKDADLHADYHELQIGKHGVETTIECTYKDSKWSPEETSTPFMLKFEKVWDLSGLKVDLRIDEQDGYCAKEGRGQKRFVCRSAGSKPKFTVSYDKIGAHTRLRTENGSEIALHEEEPRVVEIPDGAADFVLSVRGDAEPITFPVRVIHAASCSSLPCASKSAERWLCYDVVCRDTDRPHCCGTPAKCEALSGGCPEGTSLQPDRSCAGSTCDAATDVATCCTKGDTGDGSGGSGAGNPRGESTGDSGGDGSGGSSAGAESTGGGLDDQPAPGGAHAPCSSAPKICHFGFRLRPDAEKVLCASRQCGVRDAGVCCTPCQRYDVGCNLSNESRLARCPECIQAWDPDVCCRRVEAELEKAREAEKGLELEGKQQAERLSYFDALGCFPEAMETCDGKKCFFDESCIYNPPRHGGAGCRAGMNDARCRFCGFASYEPCPVEGSCFDGLCEHWGPEKLARCATKHGMHCPRSAQALWSGGPLWGAAAAPMPVALTAAVVIALATFAFVSLRGWRETIVPEQARSLCMTDKGELEEWERYEPTAEC